MPPFVPFARTKPYERDFTITGRSVRSVTRFRRHVESNGGHFPADVEQKRRERGASGRDAAR